jgi:hypothetical protein
MWTALKYVSSAVTLIAFICAIAAWMYRSYLQGRERLIKTVPEGERARLVEKTFVLFNIDTAKLSRKHQYDLALKQIRERITKFLVTAVVIVIIAGLGTVLAFVAMPKTSPPPVPTPTPAPTPESLSGKIERVEVIPGPDGNTQVFMLLSIENTGTPVSINQYAIQINHVTSKSFEYNGQLNEEIKGPYTLPQAGGKAAVVIQPQDSIISKTSEAIGTGREVRGWLKLALPIPDKVLSQPGTRYRVSFVDATQKTHQAVYQMQ